MPRCGGPLDALRLRARFVHVGPLPNRTGDCALAAEAPRAVAGKCLAEALPAAAKHKRIDHVRLGAVVDFFAVSQLDAGCPRRVEADVGWNDVSAATKGKCVHKAVRCARTGA